MFILTNVCISYSFFQKDVTSFPYEEMRRNVEKVKVFVLKIVVGNYYNRFWNALRLFLDCDKIVKIFRNAISCGLFFKQTEMM